MKEQELTALMNDLSLEEKVMQLVQLPGVAYESGAAVTGLLGDSANAQTLRLAGSTLGIWGAEKLNRLQRQYMENHPHHIPLLMMLDVIHGHKTVFPCPLGQGASFDPELTEQAAAVQAQEAAADGIHVTFSPMADLSRDARWGRVMESTGEDKYLNGCMAAAMTRGYQGKDLTDGDSVAACVKHFAAYGAAEAGRDYQNTELSEHTLREQYLPAYQSGVDAGARLVMSSFNTWDGVPSSASPWLMKTVLREEMGFSGVVISDWNAVGELVNHGIAKDEKEAALLAMRAGIDIDMCSGCYEKHLQELVEEGKVSLEALDAAVLRVLRLKNELGLFENPFHGAAPEKAKAVLGAPMHRALARKAVAESLVLLKNEGESLPLKGKKIAFIGPYADQKHLQSAWAISTDREDSVTVRQAAKEAFEGQEDELRFVPGCLMLNEGTNTSLEVFTCPDWEKENDRLLSEAKEAAAWADTVVLCLGEHFLQTGESASRVDINLPRVQTDLLAALRPLSKRLATLVFCGRPLTLKEESELSDALMICWLPGTEGGHGIMDVLTGKEAPSGKLPMSFPRHVGQEPLHYDQYRTGRPRPKDGIGSFTSHYLDCPNEALYPFGYGLTYTDFRVSEVRLSSEKLSQTGEITAAVTLKNAGKTAGTAVLQMYIRDLVGSRVRPVRELKGFRRVTLQPGEEQEVTFTIDEPMLRFWTINRRMESEPGDFQLWIGLDSTTENAAFFKLTDND
ncbi:MAG: beta-glucosidase BglX [Clostridia bacterium]|nr:beta-glucosidase BglX [Clostridia bacterium]